jgi:hypothetical protein
VSICTHREMTGIFFKLTHLGDYRKLNKSVQRLWDFEVNSKGF